MRTLDFVDTFSVDAGNLSAVDADFIRGYGGDPAEADGQVDLVPGRYLVVLHSDDTWNGVVTAAGVVHCLSGTILLGDVCYAFPNNTEQDRLAWHKFLKETDFLQDFGTRGVCMNLGGDGRFSANIIVKSLPDLGEESETEKVL